MKRTHMWTALVVTSLCGNLLGQKQQTASESANTVPRRW